MGKKIMVVDDDPVHTMVLEEKIRKTGLADQVLVFYQSEEALRFLHDCPESQLPDVLLVDINMPDMNGWDFLDNYADLPHKQSTQVYMISSSTARREKARALAEPHVSGCLHKPVTGQQLVGILALA
jgi:CheY-like chemotaxis protein